MSTSFSFSTADTWNADVNYSECIENLCRSKFSNVFVPGCGRGRFILELILAKRKSKSESKERLSFFCVDLQRKEIDNFIKKLKGKKFREKKSEYSSCQCFKSDNLNVYFYTGTVQKFLQDNAELKFDLIIALLFFHYVPDAWASILFDMLEHLNKDGIFIFDEIVGVDPINDELMSVMDASWPTRTTISTVFSAKFSSMDQGDDGQKKLLQEWKNYFTKKLLERSIFWNSTIKATDVDEITHCLDPLFAKKDTKESKEFTPDFSKKHVHVPWCWGENILLDVPSTPCLDEKRPIVKYKFYIFEQFLQTNISSWRRFFYDNATLKAIAQFDSIPWILEKKFSTRDAIVFSQNILPQCMLQTIASSGLFSSSSDIVNLFLCLNSPIQSSSVVSNLCYIVNEFCTSPHENANRFIANAAYHACIARKSLSNTFFETEEKTIILSESRIIDKTTLDTMKNRCRQEGFQIKEIKTGQSPTFEDSNGTSLGFLMHWGLGNNVDVKQIYNKCPFENTLNKYHDTVKDKQSDIQQYASPLEIMDLDAVIFVPFVGFQTVSDSYSISSDTHPFCGLGIGIHRATEQSIDETLRIVHLVSILVTRLMDAQLTLHWALQAETTSLQVAVSAIMSRNGSHNIGSHVLSTLSHNIGTMPEDRILYQYIQQRMDYVATVATEFPNWTVPTRFVGNLMRAFFTQKHLLEHISQSEGLNAYQFQRYSAATKQEAKIKIYLRRLRRESAETAPQENYSKEWEKFYSQSDRQEYIDFIKYEDNKPTVNLHVDDVTLAIPGGVVGQHAFYTIIENIIRNAAKHEWATSNAKSAFNNLGIHIDFIDLKDESTVEFTVWSDCCKLKNVRRNNAGVLDDATTIKKYIDDPASMNDLPLHQQQQIRLAESLIDKNGVLRRANWGLAEMKISAGYLKCSSIEEISTQADTIITPVAIPDSDSKEQDIFHLGYRFAIPKPKKILIVLKNDEPVKGTNKHGVFFKTIENINKTEKNRNGFVELTYEYVVLPEGEVDAYKNWLLPFRVLKRKETNGNIILYATDPNIFVEIGIGNITDIAENPEFVYDAWLKGLKNRVEVGEDVKISLQVQADAVASGSEKTKGNLDLYRVVFNECYRSVLMEATRTQNDKTARLLTTLLALMPMESISFPDDGGESSRGYIRKQLQFFCDRFKQEMSLNNHFLNAIRLLYNEAKGELPVAEINSFEQEILYNLQLELNGNNSLMKSRGKALIQYLLEIDKNKLKAALDIFCGKVDTQQVQLPNSDCYNIYDDGYSMLPQNIALFFGAANSNTSAEFSKLVENLYSTYLASDIFLRQYEENISTLPLFYKSNGEKTQSKMESCKLNGIRIYNEGESNNNQPIIRYVRHDNTQDGLYVEALSGSQSYLNILEHFDAGNSELIVRLVENALLRVLFIDERVYNFFKNRRGELSTCRKMRIFVVDVSGGKASQGFVSVNKKKNDFGIRPGEYDILIIHQGLIDKWRDPHDKAVVGKLLNALREVVPWVVVTTGRGRPDNIPDDARILPFSTIESTILRKYPEKMILVNTVMNILPKSPHIEGNKQSGENEQ